MLPPTIWKGEADPDLLGSDLSAKTLDKLVKQWAAAAVAKQSPNPVGTTLLTECTSCSLRSSAAGICLNGCLRNGLVCTGSTIPRPFHSRTCSRAPSSEVAARVTTGSSNCSNGCDRAARWFAASSCQCGAGCCCLVLPAFSPPNT